MEGSADNKEKEKEKEKEKDKVLSKGLEKAKAKAKEKGLEAGKGGLAGNNDATITAATAMKDKPTPSKDLDDDDVTITSGNRKKNKKKKNNASATASAGANEDITLPKGGISGLGRKSSAIFVLEEEEKDKAAGEAASSTDPTLSDPVTDGAPLSVKMPLHPPASTRTMSFKAMSSFLSRRYRIVIEQQIHRHSDIEMLIYMRYRHTDIETHRDT